MRHPDDSSAREVEPDVVPVSDGDPSRHEMLPPDQLLDAKPVREVDEEVAAPNPVTRRVPRVRRPGPGLPTADSVNCPAAVGAHVLEIIPDCEMSGREIGTGHGGDAVRDNGRLREFRIARAE